MTKRKQAGGAREGIEALNVPQETHEACQKARTILECAHKCSSSLFKAYQLVKIKRGAERGMTTDEEQDLLRAMLVMAAAGLDGMLKQLIRDTVPLLVGIDDNVRANLEKYVTRQIKAESDDVDLQRGATFLGRILSAASQQSQVIQEWTAHLTGGSLQSPAELQSIAGAFAVPPKEIPLNIQRLKEIFRVRNNIIHELDMDLSGKRRKRTVRKQPDMLEHTNELLLVGLGFIVQVSRKLAGDKPAETTVASDS